MHTHGYGYLNDGAGEGSTGSNQRVRGCSPCSAVHSRRHQHNLWTQFECPRENHTQWVCALPRATHSNGPVVRSPNQVTGLARACPCTITASAVSEKDCTLHQGKYAVVCTLVTTGVPSNSTLLNQGISLNRKHVCQVEDMGTGQGLHRRLEAHTSHRARPHGTHKGCDLNLGGHMGAGPYELLQEEEGGGGCGGDR